MATEERTDEGTLEGNWASCWTRSVRPARGVRQKGADVRPLGLRGGREGPRRLVGEAGRGAAGLGRGARAALDDADPPSTSGSTGGKINVSHNCLDRHVDAGNGDRVAFHWRGEEGEERDVTYAELLADVQSWPTP